MSVCLSATHCVFRVIFFYKNLFTGYFSIKTGSIIHINIHLAIHESSTQNSEISYCLKNVIPLLYFKGGDFTQKCSLYEENISGNHFKKLFVTELLYWCKCRCCALGTSWPSSVTLNCSTFAPIALLICSFFDSYYFLQLNLVYYFIFV